MTDPLFIDIGNSSIKMCRCNESDQLHSFRNYPYIKKNFEFEFSFLIKAFLNSEPTDAVFIINSDRTQNEVIEKIFSKTPAKAIIFNNSSEGIVNILYEDTLGADRYCAMNGAKSIYSDKENILVIDLGTATTFNFITGSDFIGGLIFPGVSSSVEMLSERTGLPMSDLKKEPGLIENTTEGNIRSGIMLSNIIALNGLIKMAIEKYNNIYVIATGGSYDIIKDHLNNIETYNEYLKFEGMKVLRSKLILNSGK